MRLQLRHHSKAAAAVASESKTLTDGSSSVKSSPAAHHHHPPPAQSNSLISAVLSAAAAAPPPEDSSSAPANQPPPEFGGCLMPSSQLQPDITLGSLNNSSSNHHHHNNHNHLHHHHHPGGFHQQQEQPFNSDCHIGKSLIPQPGNCLLSSGASSTSPAYFHGGGGGGGGGGEDGGSDAVMNNYHQQQQPSGNAPGYIDVPPQTPMSPYQPGPGPGGMQQQQNLPPMMMGGGYGPPGTPGPQPGLQLQQQHIPAASAGPYSTMPPPPQPGMLQPMQSMSPNFQQQQHMFPPPGPVPPGVNMHMMSSQSQSSSPFSSHRRAGSIGGGGVGGMGQQQPQQLLPPGVVMGGGGPGGGGPGMMVQPGPPLISLPESRIQEMNKRLLLRAEDCDNLWWDCFASDFFEDDARVIIRMGMEGDQTPQGPRQYSIGRSLIPRFFRSYFEGGVIELQYQLRHPRESFHQGIIILDCENAVQETTHCKPTFAKVYAEGRLIIQFTNDELMRIRSWVFAIRSHREYVPRNTLSMQHDPMFLDQHSKNITVSGLNIGTLNFLRLCLILEPMQQIMARNKAYSLPPRDCLSSILFDKWKSTVTPPEAARGANKRRKRKATTPRAGSVASVQNGPIGGGSPGSSTPVPQSHKKGKSGGGGGSGNGNAPSTPGTMPLASQDVMIVGEPTLMGGDFGDEDERLITRLENNQFDPSLVNHMQNQHPALSSRSSSMEDPNHIGRMSSAVQQLQQQHDSILYSSPPRGGVIRPPSTGGWQNRPGSATSNNNTPTSSNEGKNRSPNT
ncbi:LIM domain-binding protein 2 [Hypsibius exemplaris]|uniref:LIM domain-binding protein 2 n=1 Tax=Hypsibius exemplaris TaxID=2072580 RepID=A0A1W0X8Z1_HYPEX|nr:LIM domain-binding protein 2 [Hypsibius exemplaris]